MSSKGLMATPSENVRASSGNAIKADFDDRAKGPRGYFGISGGLDRVIPEIAAPCASPSKFATSTRQWMKSNSEGQLN
jgi:hypothetical protein